MGDPDIVRAPWPPQVVRHLNAFQELASVHPFTCANRGDGNHEEADVLVATVQGWICPFCDYRQDWAHSFMMNFGK